ncbi:MAG TPA: argininosuccinate lyase [Solirubrobacterales bacterium]|jgi:argininosuccinate lyase|nr:argininosuccinate lyase [Solirubrobacterales bacterium]
MARFDTPQDDLFKAINSSLDFDRRLYPEDIEGSIAHAEMLAAQHIIDAGDLEQIKNGMTQVKKELDSGVFDFKEDDEDIHMAIERRLTELVGEPGAKLHTARSRNDQVATDVALYTRRRAQTAVGKLARLMRTLYKLAQAHRDWPMPGYTHLQRAQSVYLAQHLLAYFWMFQRDRRRFTQVVESANMLPLGAGALAGVNWDTDRQMLADRLGFKSIAPNSMDAVANRDFVLDYLSAAATCATHLSRLGAEIVIWSSEEFGFCEVSDGFASGSSLMPQKKNPDAAELLRGKSPRVIASLTTLHGVMHGLPLTYNKDMQEDKEALFDAVDTIELCLDAAIGMLGSITFKKERLAEAAGDEMLAAVDIADLLVRKGMPFREAHGTVGSLVRYAIEQDKKLSELSTDELAKFSDLFDDEYHALLSGNGWIESKQSQGGTSSKALDYQFELANAILDACQ